MLLRARSIISRRCSGTRATPSFFLRNLSVAVEVEDVTMQLSSEGRIETTPTLNIVDATENPKWPVFRVLDPRGHVINGVDISSIDVKSLVDKYELMARIRAFDDIMYNAQRQGRISFYMQNLGEEASHLGSASALTMKDMIFAQYRELGVLFWRGLTVQEAADQCFSNEADKGKGRQMPVHYGRKNLNFQTIASPLATQMPQAVGAAYAYKNKNAKELLKDPNFNLVEDGQLVACYFGEGAASEGDAHAAFNFSATLDVPILFICRNNGFAISTPTRDQYRGDGIISRAAGYGMKAIRVDGNDILAVELATRAARKIALEENCPVLLECMTYRGGHHSTSDDSTRYRSMSEMQHWTDHFDPMTRLRTYLESQGLWDASKDQQLQDEERMIAIKAMEVAEARPKPSISEMFTDVYYDIPKHLQEQGEAVNAHIRRHPEYYK